MSRTLRRFAHAVIFEFQEPDRESFAVLVGDGALTRVGMKALKMNDLQSIVEEAVERALRRKGRNVVTALERWSFDCGDTDGRTFSCAFRFSFLALDEKSRNFKGEGEGYAEITCFIEPKPYVKPIHRTFCTVQYVKGKYLEEVF
ncbi:MAG: hypothetical protein QXJ59_06410 [Thermofilaceae archaeon]